MPFDALSNLGLAATVRAALAELGRGLRPAAHARARRRARQRRPGPPGGVLHGEHGDAGDPGARLRHPLRSRHLPAGADGRVAARAAGRVAVVRQSWEFERPEVALHDRLRRDGRGIAMPTGDAARHVWHPAETVQRRGLRHADRRLARRARQHAAAVVGARRRPAVASTTSIAAITSARWPTACGSRRSRACSIRATRRRRAQELRLRQEYLLRLGVAAGPRAPAPGAARRTWHRSPTTPRSSSTIRIRRSPFPSSCGSWSTSTALPWDLAWSIATDDLQLHQPHAAARGAGDLAACALLERLLPRHLQIIYRINALHLDALRAPGTTTPACSLAYR